MASVLLDRFISFEPCNIYNRSSSTFYCHLCNFSCDNKTILQSHKKEEHYSKFRRPYICNFCDDCFDSITTLDQHKSYKHDVNVKYFYCDEYTYEGKLCDFKTKQPGGVNRHKKFKHNIDVKWYKCGIDNCVFQAKQAYDLKKHKANVHDIGNLNCEICYSDVGVLRKHTKPDGTEFKACRKCVPKKERIEIRYMNYLRRELLFPFDHDTRIMGETCTRYRPDAMFLDIDNKVHIQFELDEHQHLWENGDYSCDERRISIIYDEFKNNVPEHFVVVRLNPDGYEKNRETRDKVFRKRLRHLVKILNYVRENPPPHLLSIVYMYYDRNNKRLAQNIPKYFVDDEEKALIY